MVTFVPAQPVDLVADLIRLLAGAYGDEPADAPCHIDMTFGEARKLHAALTRLTNRDDAE